MTQNGEKQFTKAQKEIEGKIRQETKSFEEEQGEQEELIKAKEGYQNFYENLCSFITESMVDFTVNEEELGSYFKSNINSVYQNYINIRKDAVSEIERLQKYSAEKKRYKSTKKRSLKFYKSQDLDSDFFSNCMPLIEIYQKEVDLIIENIAITQQILDLLKKIEEKLESW
jgi:hypothetical protein